MTQELIDEVERQFAILVRQARHSLRRRSAEVHPDLTTMGYKVAAVLSREEPLTQGRIVDELDSDKATVSRTVKQLEELALVERSPDPTDRRSWLLRLTAEARERVQASTSSERKLLHSRLANWDIASLEEFISLLSRLNESSRECHADRHQGEDQPARPDPGQGS